ncbi:MAG: TolC family protein [Methylococcaceae bacterium]|nr:TolC family protein [Methylococcaceae bacterium]
MNPNTNPFKKILVVFCKIVFCLFWPSVFAETKTYSVPPPPDMLEQRVELVEPKGTLALAEALSLALLHNPALQDFAWEIRISDVKALRAGLLPNPELEIEGENFLGSRELHDFDQTETTFSISQLFELGSKRSKRRALANTERDLALWDYETKRLDVIYQIASRYIEVVANQDRLKLANESTLVAEEIYKTVVARVDAGMVSPLEKSKSRVELAKANLNKARIARQLVSNKQNLAAVWGSFNALFKEVNGDLYAVQTAPDFSVLLSRLEKNPDLARWSAEIERYRKAIDLAKAQKIPNITFTAGGRHFSENDDFAVVAGISVPLFIFDTKQTGVDEAQMILAQAVQKQKATTVAIRSSLIKNYQQLQMSLTELTAFRDEVLPSTKNALKAAKLAYRLGEIGSLNLLDTQRTSFQSNRDYLDALASYHQNVAIIERLIGGALNPSQKTNELTK